MTKLRVAVIGAGHWGPNLVRNFYGHDQARVTVVADKDPARRALTAQRFPNVDVIEDGAAAAVRDDVDAVVIATPTSTHFALARAALEAKKHVLVEKPITADVDEAEVLAALAEANGCVLAVGHVFLHNTGIQRVKAYLDDGALGEVRYISMERTNLGPIRSDVSAAWDLAAHDISIANDWLGGLPRSVAATGGAWVRPAIHDAIFATLTYADHILVHLHASWLNPRKVRNITVVGANKMLTFDDMNMTEPVRLYDKTVTSPSEFVDNFASFQASTRDGDILIPKVAAGEPLRSECDDFLAAIIDGRRPRADGRDGVDVVKVLAAIDESIAAQGKTVML